MNKKFLSMAAAAMMFAACSEDALQTEPIEVAKTPAVAGQTPIGFSAYTGRGVTRAGATGELTTSGTTSLNAHGFGVFAYYTDANEYAGNSKPDFMYNQKVENNGSAWIYDPVKYWPNEYGADAQSADIDLVSFFAYAPYVVSAEPSQGTVSGPGSTTTGIVGFSRNNANGDPIVKYVSTFNTADQVDLSWGTVHNDTRVWKTLTGADHNFTPGMPWKDVEHPANIDQKMKFNFQHALAQLNVQIDVDADEINHYNGQNGPDSKTKVFVKSVKFDGFAQKGALNLNNIYANTPLWMNFNGQGLLSEAKAEAVTLSGSNLNTTIRVNQEGVTGTLKNLFNVDSFTGGDDAKRDASVYVIPNGQSMTMTIVYTVETEDDNLAGYLSDGTTHGSVVENKITKEVKFGSANLRAGYRHILKLHLGLNSVKFDAAVADWGDATESNTWVPENKGAGVYNPLNPLTIVSAEGGETAVGLKGASATSYPIVGAGTNHAVLLASTSASTNWTVSEGVDVVQIAGETTGAITRATNVSSITEWGTEVSGSQYIVVKPVNKGQAIITSELNGNTSTIVITVDAPYITLTTTDHLNNPVSAESVTMYKFKNNATYTITAEGHANSAGTAVGSTFNWTSSDESVATVNDGIVTLVKAGTAKITVKDETTGVYAISEVTVVEAAITASVTDIALRPGFVNSAQLKFTMTPSDLNPKFTLDSGYDSYFTFDENSYVVTAVKPTNVGTANIKVQFTGHEYDSDEFVTFTVKVQDTDPGIALTESDSKKLGRVVVSDVAKTYASVSEAEMWGHNPIAVVAWVATGTDYVDSNASNYHALAIGRSDIGKANWLQKDNETETSFTSGAYVSTTYSGSGDNAFSDLRGIENYNALVNKKVNAALLVNDYTVATPKKEDGSLATSGWFLPTIGQWNKMIVSLAKSTYEDAVWPGQTKQPSNYHGSSDKDIPRWTWFNEGYKAAQLNPQLKAYGIDNLQSFYYWSSTEYNGAYAWSVVFYHGTVNYTAKTTSTYVRPVLAF